MNAEEVLKELESEFQELLKLKHDWDEEGSDPTNIETVERAKRFINQKFEFFKKLFTYNRLI